MMAIVSPQPHACLACVLVLLAPTPTWAEPHVDVRSDTLLVVERALESSGERTVALKLTDDRGLPLPGESIELAWRAGPGNERPQDRRWRDTDIRETDAAGTILFKPPPGLPASSQLRARFHGNAHLTASERTLRLDPTRVPVNLSLPEGPPAMFLRGASDNAVAVLVTAPRSVGEVGVTLRDAEGRIVTKGRTGTDGRAHLRVPDGSLSERGRSSWSVSSQATTDRQSAVLAVPVVIGCAPHFALEAQPDKLFTDSHTLVQGRLVGCGVEDLLLPIGLFSGQRHLASTRSGTGGRFSLDWTTPSTGGPQRLGLRFAGAPSRGLAPAISHVNMRIATRSGVPWSAALVPALVAILTLLFTRWRHDRRARQAPGQPGDPLTEMQTFVAGELQRGLRQGRVSGTVQDLRFGQALETAQMVLRNPAAAIPVGVGSGGQFETGVLPPGSWELCATAPGFRTSVHRLTIPHRGEWTGCTLQLESQRVRALVPFRKLALHLLPARRLWGTWTDREISAWRDQDAPGGDAFKNLTERVERACYARIPPSQEEVEAIETQARALNDETR